MFVFDPGLSGQQPVQGIVQVIFVGVAHTEFVSQGGGVPQAGGGEFRTGMEELFGHHGHDQIALLAGFGSNEGVKAKTAHSAQDRLDGAIPAIRDPAGHPVALCQPARRVTEEDALHESVDDHAPSDHEPDSRC